MEELPSPLQEALVRMGLLGKSAAPPASHRLAGGVSSDIWRVDLPNGPICLKRALSRLRVAAEWHAPVERNLYEARWMERAAAAAPGCVPTLLGRDGTTGTIAMAYLDPARFPLWKARLRDGNADPVFAAAVGDALVRIHADTAADPAVAAAFPTDAIFHAIRLEPYLLAAGRANPDVAETLEALVAVTARTRRTLVHGDISPKNILVGEHHPVFLDAECAWWGDPAFDVAFCLNHLLLKCLWVPAARQSLLASFDALSTAYLDGVNWEPRAELEARAARLLPGLLLARVDGKSPVEYISEDAQRDQVRSVARMLLAARAGRLGAVRAAWANSFARSE